MGWLETAPFTVLAGLIAACVLSGLEAGHQLGRRVPVLEAQAATIAGSSLALVGLIFAFTFSMAGERHAARRAAAVQEVNAIGTIWLRTSLVEDPTRSELRSRLRRYVELHIVHRAAGDETARTRAAEAEGERLQAELWSVLMESARRGLEPVRLHLLTEALNAMIDDTSSLIAAGENRLPQPIVGCLFVLSILAGIVVGYRPSAEQRNLVLWLLFSIVLSGVTSVLLDLDRPRHGLIQTDAHFYLRLRESLQEQPP